MQTKIVELAERIKTNPNLTWKQRKLRIKQLLFAITMLYAKRRINVVEYEQTWKEVYIRFA